MILEITHVYQKSLKMFLIKSMLQSTVSVLSWLLVFIWFKLYYNSQGCHWKVVGSGNPLADGPFCAGYFVHQKFCNKLLLRFVFPRIFFVCKSDYWCHHSLVYMYFWCNELETRTGSTLQKLSEVLIAIHMCVDALKVENGWLAKKCPSFWTDFNINVWLKILLKYCPRMLENTAQSPQHAMLATQPQFSSATYSAQIRHLLHFLMTTLSL